MASMSYSSEDTLLSRVKLVSVLLNPDSGPVLAEEDPSARRTLLGSLNAFQQERQATTARTSQPRDPAPMPSAPPMPSPATSAQHAPQYPRTAKDVAPAPAAQTAAPSAPPLPPELTNRVGPCGADEAVTVLESMVGVVSGFAFCF